LLATATTALALVASAGVARAGTYVINNCPAAGNGNAGPWVVFGGEQGAKATCSGGAGDWIGPLGGQMSVNEVAGDSVTVPAGSGLTILEAKVWWYVPAKVSGGDTFAIASATGGSVGQAATPLDRRSTPDDFVLASTTTSFELASYCSNDDYSNPCTMGGGVNPDLELLGSQLTLSGSGPPSGTVTGGALAGSATVSGKQSLSFDASDGASGVRFAQLLVDGRVVATNDYASECPYQNFAACPTTISDSVAWNTAAVSNGPHEVALRIVNAAQVAAVIDDHTLTVHNPPHTPNGSPACEPARLTIHVNGRSAKATVRYGHRATVRGTLLCGSAPIIGATILVGGGGLHTSVSTNQLGQFSFAIPRGPNRTVRFGYRAYADDAKLAAAVRAHITVLPQISLAIAPRRTVNDGTIEWRGDVEGGPYPAGGVTLLAEVREGSRWQPFDEILAPHGRFVYRYTFLRTTQPTRYRFRVALPENGAGGYDYTPAGSNSVLVSVR
jgi:hypothetical protein